jgi:hypothetical protein
MEQDYSTHLKLARLFFENHWLSHAKQKCQEALSLGSPAAETYSLLAETEHRLTDESCLNLSLDAVFLHAR